MHPNTLWQDYHNTLEKILTPKSTHLALVYYSVAWLKSHYKSFQKSEQMLILTNPIFNYNFADYAIEHQALTAWETFRRYPAKGYYDIVALCDEAIFPMLIKDCEQCLQGNLKPITDDFGNEGFFCDTCNASFTRNLKLAPDEYGKPMTLEILQNNGLDKLLLPNPLKKGKSTHG